MPRADRLRHRAAVLLLVPAMLSACGGPEPSSAQRTPPASTIAGTCRIGPDGGPPIPMADRGIGGTGAPSRQAERRPGGAGAPATTMLVNDDRGIGGTGGPMRQADRGIGGTGIVAVITGFASICLGGREVALEAGTPVLVDGEEAAPSVLRAGQLVAVNALGSGDALRATRVRVRHEIIGPVEAVQPNGSLRVAGQRVAITGETFGDRAPAVGQWVAISGLRRPDGSVAATRIDVRRADLAMVHGRVLREGDALRLGTLALRFTGAPSAMEGQYVTARGPYVGGALLVQEVMPDLLRADPAAYFGPSVGTMLVETYAADLGGRLWLGPGVTVEAPGGLGTGVPRRAVVELQRSAGSGSLRATGLRESGPDAAPFGRGGASPFGPGLRGEGRPGDPLAARGHGVRRSEPAPVPHRMPSLNGEGIAGGQRPVGGMGAIGGARPDFGERGVPGPVPDQGLPPGPPMGPGPGGWSGGPRPGGR